MTDAISQIQAAYEPLEDRILLNITTQNQHVYSVWLTRRYTKLLIPALQGKHPRTGRNLLSENALGLMHQSLSSEELSSSVFSDYQLPEQAEYPLGEEAIVLAKIGFTDLSTEQPMIDLNPEQGDGFSLPYEAHVLKLLLNVLSKALQRANWDVEIDESLQQPEKHLLH